jgi:hypothetical protein
MASGMGTPDRNSGTYPAPVATASAHPATADCHHLRWQLLARCEGVRLPLREARELARHLETCAECDRNKNNIAFLRRCCRIHPWVEGLRSGGLPAPARETVHAHLEECRSCRREAGSSVELAGRPQPLGRAIRGTGHEVPVPPAPRSALVGGLVCAALTAVVLWLTTEATGSPPPIPPAPTPSVSPRAGGVLPTGAVAAPSPAGSALPTASLVPAGGDPAVARARPAAPRPPAPATATAPVTAQSPAAHPPPPIIPPLPTPPRLVVLR